MKIKINPFNRLINILQYLRHYTLQKFRKAQLTTFIPFFNVQTWKTLSITSTIFIKILRLLWRRNITKNQRFWTLYRNGIMEISVLVYTKPTHTNQYLHYSSHHQKSCKESVVTSLLIRAYSIITNKDDLTKENATIKQVLKEN